jgi:hypothetical protein
MYGMVNKAICDLITTQHGEAVWEQVRAKAELQEEVFISNVPYPDAITYRLVKEASEILQISPEKLLIQFGRWWVLETARKGYGHLMEAGGRTLAEFLIKLPNFHTRIVMIFPELKPPEFECTDISPNSLRLHYHSDRPGLAPFVVGLLEGLGEMFATQIEVQHEENVAAGAEHDVFKVSWPIVERS